MNKLMGTSVSLLILGAGIAFYVIFRSQNPPLFMPFLVSLIDVNLISLEKAPFFDFVPTLTHTLAFMIFTCTWFSASSHRDNYFIASWSVIELIAEIFQSSDIFAKENLARLYQPNAVFSWDDVSAILAAIIVAKMVMLAIRKKA